MEDIRQSSNYAKYMQKVGWTVEKVGSIYCYIKRVPILGAIIKVQRPVSLKLDDLNKIENLRTKYRVFQIIIEPNSKSQVGTVTSRGYKLTKSPFLPSKTLILKLNKNKKELFNNLKKDTRYSINKANHNLKDPVVYNLTAKSFHEIMKGGTSWQRHVPSVRTLKALKDSFAHHALFVTSHNSNTGAIFLLNKKVAYYWQAFTDKSGRASLLQYKLLWEGVLWAKDNGAQYFDFEGIFDKRFPNKSWKGFTGFKTKFGGKPTPYPGAYKKLFLNQYL